jgi:photosystem II stability/assembly factor-like uncharacterized protein
VFKTVSVVLALLAATVSLQAAAKWKIQYFYDKADSWFDIRDLRCPTPSDCIAAGTIDDKKGHSKGIVLRTTDSGGHWVPSDVSEQPVSLFFLDASQGWMVTERGLWSTSDGGTSWKKLEGLKKGLLESYFLNPLHGFVIGFPKAVYETRDGGKKWTRVAAANNPTTTPLDTVYESISFLGEHGFIIGNAAGRDADETPVWMNPSEARFHRERPATLVVLETMDGGKTWDSHNTSFYGSLTQLVQSKEDDALALVEYHNYYTLPSRIYKVKFRTSMDAIFGERDRAVTDIALLPDGSAIIAAVEPPGASNQIPIPGKLKILRSADRKVWEEMNVDYRAVAQRATLAVPDAQHMWVATDTGMILTLEQQP